MNIVDLKLLCTSTLKQPLSNSVYTSCLCLYFYICTDHVLIQNNTQYCLECFKISHKRIPCCAYLPATSFFGWTVCFWDLYMSIPVALIHSLTLLFPMVSTPHWSSTLLWLDISVASNFKQCCNGQPLTCLLEHKCHHFLRSTPRRESARSWHVHLYFSTYCQICFPKWLEPVLK